MLIYVCIDVLIILLGAFFANHSIKVGSRSFDGRSCFFTLAAAILIFISAFRGNFTTDYDHYVDIYNMYSDYSIIEILQRGYLTSPETGYVLFQHIIGEIFRSPLYIFIITSLIIVLCNLRHLKKYVSDLLLGVLLFIEGGIYFTSFNLMRQCLAASIVIMGSKFLYERKTWSYILIVIFASTFHLSSLIMIPFYFFATFKLNKNLIVYIFIISSFVGIAPVAVNLVQTYFWSWHEVADFGGYSWKNIVLPAAISVFVFVSYSVNSVKNTGSGVLNDRLIQNVSRVGMTRESHTFSADISNIWLNATILYFAFTLMGLWFSLANRFSTFFSLYAICLFANQIEKNKYKDFFKLGTIVLLVLYGYITKAGDFPYYFIWER